MIRKNNLMFLGIPLVGPNNPIEASIRRYVFAPIAIIGFVVAFLVIGRFVHTGGPSYANAVITIMLSVPAVAFGIFDMIVLIWVFSRFRLCA